MLCGGVKAKRSAIEECYYSVQGGEIRSRCAPPARAAIGSSLLDDNSNMMYVEINCQPEEGLGITLTGGLGERRKALVASLDPNGAAYRSDLVQVGDRIASINGVATATLTKAEMTQLLSTCIDTVLLHIEYPLPPQADPSVVCVRRTMKVRLEEAVGGWGITVRGGYSDTPSKCRPLVITHIRPNSPAVRHSAIHVGDRLLAVNGHNVSTLTLSEVIALLRHSTQSVQLVIEYDVAVIEALETSRGPVLVEIEKSYSHDLGVLLMECGRGRLGIRSVRPASIADRCGALHPGDQVLFINDVSVADLSSGKAQRLLDDPYQQHLRLHIVPVVLSKSLSMSQDLHHTLSLISLRSTDTFDSMTTHVGSAGEPSDSSTSLKALALGRRASSSAGSSGTIKLSHPEVLYVTLVTDERGSGVVLENTFDMSDEVLREPPLVSHVIMDSPAYCCGVIHEGDRILSVNGINLSLVSLAEASRLLAAPHCTCSIRAEYDITDAVSASSGVFKVKLVKNSATLGITISGTSSQFVVEPLVITQVAQGSIAHRSGMLHIGDRLFAVNGHVVDSSNFAEAIRLLHDCDDIVELTLSKELPSACQDSRLSDGGRVTYTVEMQKQGGPLGVTITGTEQPGDPVIISLLSSDGLAARTGALRVGDEILAINGHDLAGKTLADAIELLQSKQSVVSLKIARRSWSNSLERQQQALSGHSPLMSMDSALASSDSLFADTQRQRKVLQGHIPESVHVSHRQAQWRSCQSAPPSLCLGPEDHWSADVDQLDQLGQLTSAEPLDSPRDSPSLSSPSLPATGIITGTTTTTTGATDSHTGQQAQPLLTYIIKQPEVPLFNLSSRHSTEIDQPVSSVNPPLTEQSQITDPHVTHEQQSTPDIAPAHHVISSEFISSASANSEQSSVSLAAITGYQDGADLSSDKQKVDVDTTPNVLADSECEAKQTCDNGVESLDIRLQEVEEQLQNIFTPTPIELIRLTLVRATILDDWGFSLSDGVYEKGVYVSNIRVDSQTSSQLVLYDRLLQVNERRVADWECSQVVPVLREAGLTVSIIVSRNPLASAASILGTDMAIT